MNVGRNLAIINLLYGIGTGCIKLSFALTLFHILLPGSRRWAVVVAMAAVVAFTSIYFFFNLLKCRPLTYQWTVVAELLASHGRHRVNTDVVRHGHCIAVDIQQKILYVHGAMMLAVDFGLGIVMPVLILNGMQMKWHIKITTGILLGLGSLASVATNRTPGIHQRL